MANFLITLPNGKKYKVGGAASKEEALQHLQQQLGGGEPSPGEPSPPAPVLEAPALAPAETTASSEVAEAEQYMRGRGKELQRQEDVAQYVARPPLQRAAQDVSDIFNVAGRSAASLATGAAGLVSSGLAPLTGVSAAPISPEDVIARLRTGKAEGPEFAAEVEKQNRINEAARNRLGWAAPVAETLPMVALPVARVFGAGRPLLNLAATSAGLGAASAAGNKEDPLLGAAGGAVGGAAGYGAGKLLGAAAETGLGLLGKALPVGPLKVPPLVPVPTAKELKTLSTAAFNKADAHGVIFNRQGLQDVGQKIADDLSDRSYTPENEPGVVPVLRRFNEYLQTGNVTFKGLRALRRTAQNGYRMGMKSNNSALTAIIGHIDDLVEKMDPAHMASTSANPRAAHEAAQEGRKLYSRMAKLETVQNLIKRGELQGDTNISKNVRQAVRKQLVKIIDPSRSHGRGFTAAEKAAVEKATRTTGTQDVAHALSGLMPRDKLSAAINMASVAPTAAGGFMVGGPLGAALVVPAMAAKFGLGYAAGKVADRMAKKSVDELVDMIASGGIPKQAAQSMLQKLTASKRQAVMQGLGRIGFGLGAVAAQPLNEAYRQNE